MTEVSTFRISWPLDPCFAMLNFGTDLYQLFVDLGLAACDFSWVQSFYASLIGVVWLLGCFTRFAR